MAVLGVPAFRTSLSPTRADLAPAAIRAALAKYSLWAGGRAGIDLSGLACLDLGDVAEPDSPAGRSRVVEAVGAWLGQVGADSPGGSGGPADPRSQGGRAAGRLLVALGGDNSVTSGVARGAAADGLVTLDAHHDLRDGSSNGSPVRELVEWGIPGERIVQVGISDFANSPQYAARARDLGITVITCEDLQDEPIEQVMARALAIAGVGPRGRIHVDLDVDVCDRAAAPACPASAPGGLSAWQLRRAARYAAADARVVSMDLVEIDPLADAPDQRTVRLAALCLLEAAAGLASRAGSPKVPRGARP